METSPVPPKPSPDIWPAKIITSKSGGIATADGKDHDVIIRNITIFILYDLSKACFYFPNVIIPIATDAIHNRTVH